MESCVFCKIARGEIPSAKVYEDEHALAFLDIKPISEHHALVIPKRHCANILDIPAGELAHVMAAVKNIVDMYHDTGMTGVQIIHNAGAAAGQEVFHFHMHIIPRTLLK